LNERAEDVMSERIVRCLVAGAVAAAVFAAFYLGGANAAVLGWRGLTGVMACWGAAGGIVVASMAALTLSELIAAMLERAAGTSRMVTGLGGLVYKG